VLRFGQAPRWFVEQHGFRLFTGTRTFIHALIPWHFWRAISMSTPVHLRMWTYPLRLYALLVVLSCLMVSARTAITLPARVAPDPLGNIAAVVGAGLMPWRVEPVDLLIEQIWGGWAPRTPVDRWTKPMGYDAAGPYYPRTVISAPQPIWSIVGDTGLDTLRPAFVACAAATATFLVLPIVRRRARVRWIHVFRAGVYGLSIVAVLILANWALDVPLVVRERGGWGSTYANQLARSNSTELRLLPFVLLLWWFCAARFYLRLERPAAVAISVAIIGSIAGFTVALTLHPLRPVLPLNL